MRFLKKIVMLKLDFRKHITFKTHKCAILQVYIRLIKQHCLSVYRYLYFMFTPQSESTIFYKFKIYSLYRAKIESNMFSRYNNVQSML